MPVSAIKNNMPLSAIKNPFCKDLDKLRDEWKVPPKVAKKRMRY